MIEKRHKSSVLFVCMGNICRSPTAEGVFRHVVEADGELNVLVDSAGTHAYHVGEPPDPRAQRAALDRGVDLGRLRARRVRSRDFFDFTHILAMDQQNLRLLQEMQPGRGGAELRLFLEFAEDQGSLEVPDPYYGGRNGFERVLDLVEDASYGLLAHLKAR